MKTDICIVGAGPAGLFASIFSATSGAKTTIIEANTTACRKLLRTGRYRCNLTHTGTITDFIKAYGVFGRYLKQCLYEFSADDLRQYFAGHGLQTKVKEDGCVFPITDRASNVARVLLEDARRLSVRFLYGGKVQCIEKSQERFVLKTNQERIEAHSVIIATGGVTWPFTGSTGDGYKFAKYFGHTIIEPRASLAPLVTAETLASEVAGVGLKHVAIKARVANRRLCTSGPMIFTSDGIGGPAVFELSRLITDLLPNYANPVKINIDLIPQHEPDQLEQQIISLCSQHPKRELTDVLTILLPRTLILGLHKQLHLTEPILAADLQKTQRRELVEVIKYFPLSIVSTCPIAEATVTRGGVSTKEINAKTMESKLCSGLFFAGELINVDGPCGGFNLQIAFSTGHLAGKMAARYICQNNLKSS